jgi:hypothetical protein
LRLRPNSCSPLEIAADSLLTERGDKEPHDARTYLARFIAPGHQRQTQHASLFQLEACRRDHAASGVSGADEPALER